MKYILRPAVAQERVTRGPDGLVRITCRTPRRRDQPTPLKSGLIHLRSGPVSRRSLIAPKPTADEPESPRRGAYRPWAELLKRTFGFDVLTCPCCRGTMKLLALVTDPTSVADALRDPRRGSTCGALARPPTCRSGRPLEDRPTGQVVCSGEVAGASRRPSRTCARGARSPRCARMPLCRGSATSMPGTKPPRRGGWEPGRCRTPRPRALPTPLKSALIHLRSGEDDDKLTFVKTLGFHVLA